MAEPFFAGRCETKTRRIGVTTSASGIFARRLVSPPAIVCCWGPCPGANPRGCTVRSRAKLLSSSSETVCRKLAPRVLTATTRARPIISAVAVAAVRVGFERAESAAILPSTGESLRIGHESAAASGLIRNGASKAMPKKIAIVPPMPAATTAVVVSSAAPSRNAPASPGMIKAAPITAREGRSSSRTPWVPRIARIGAMRPARRAGLSAPRHAVSRPVPIAATGAIAVKRRLPIGNPKPFINSISPSASSTPSPIPERRTEKAEGQRLDQDRAGDHPAAGAERALHADLAHPLEHGHVEGVEDQEAAHEQRHSGEEVEDDVERPELVLDVLALALGGCDLDPLAELGAEPLAHGVDLRLPPVDDDVDLIPDVGLVEGLAGEADRHRAEALAAELEAVGELDQADDPRFDHAGWRREPQPVADLDPVAGGKALVDRDLAAACDVAALDDVGVAEVGRPRVEARDVDRRRVAALGLVVLVDHGDRREHVGDSLGDAGGALRAAEAVQRQ